MAPSSGTLSQAEGGTEISVVEEGFDLRIFEWVDIEPHDGHPQMITKKTLDESIGSDGKLVHLAEAGCFGLAYFNIHTK